MGRQIAQADDRAPEALTSAATARVSLRRRTVRVTATTLLCLSSGWVARAHIVSAQEPVSGSARASVLDSPAPVLQLPARGRDAPSGSEIAAEIRELALEPREERIFEEIARGNVPGWLRTYRRVVTTRDIDGRTHEVAFWAAPDYLAVGSDDDYFRVPLSPQTGQRVADLVGGSLPTPLMVDAIWAAAVVRLVPSPIPPTSQMTTLLVFEDHDWSVVLQRARNEAGLDALMAGHKKDVVLTARLAEEPGRVAIYGWHHLDGTPIQPLYTGHTDRWVDYSHGIRIVDRTVLIDGEPRDMADVLSDADLAPLLSAEGVTPARYPTR
jgi:hypothetical protein